jgi:hypothetical protein
MIFLDARGVDTKTTSKGRRCAAAKRLLVTAALLQLGAIFCARSCGFKICQQELNPNIWPDHWQTACGGSLTVIAAQFQKVRRAT